ncbi:hypothetical protein UFOVP245_119 [uncultured Caudovirales phage]|uniref:Baseplate wedge subunit n=1 Tax=uncultured Caudovirales phage TaxID=2100421 RepID=A0A6J7WWN1_9CAUD|nr:hypothetical protein UFOVP245_119 [uncultured Caudovirales phage]
MTGILTNSFKTKLVQTVVADIANSISDANNSYYVAFGGPNPWPDDYNPPDADNSVQSSSYDVYDKMLFGKKVSPGDAISITRKNVWTIDTIYDYYSHRDPDLYSKNFFVINKYGRVYKCLFNNYGAKSTVEPNETVTKTHFITADGYVWKYMYAIYSSYSKKFSTDTHMPVVPDPNVSLNAEDGAIHVIVLDNLGQNYISASGYVEDVLDSTLTTTTVKISNANASGITGAYNGSAFYVSAGSEEGTLAIITNFTVNSSGKFINTDVDLQGLNTSSYYNIAPRVTIVGDGFDARAVASVNTFNGSIDSVTMISRGYGYNSATVKFTANVEFGSDASAYPIISPVGGHGSDVYNELGVDTLGISLDTFSSDDFPEWINYRQTSLLGSPIATANNQVYQEPTFFQTFSLGVANLSDLMPAEEIVTGYNSGATATVVYMTTTDLYVIAPVGTFQLGETLTGFYTGITCTIAAINTRDLVPYKGDVLHLNNFQPISRDGAPSEQVKLYFKV